MKAKDLAGRIPRMICILTVVFFGLVLPAVTFAEGLPCQQ
jgi:hypothetical protein